MTPLVFLHGVGGGHHAWDSQLPYFGGLGYPSHAWDQPGYGHSPIVEPYDLEQIAASLARLIAALADEPVVLIGHSMGGFIAQETHARYPKLVKALALCFTSPAFGGDSSEFAKQFIAARIECVSQPSQYISDLRIGEPYAQQALSAGAAQTYRISLR